MIPISYLFEAVTPVEDRIAYAEERMRTAQRMFKLGRLPAAEYQRLLRQYMQIKRGIPSRQLPVEQVRTAGSYLPTSA